MLAGRISPAGAAQFREKVLRASAGCARGAARPHAVQVTDTHPIPQTHPDEDAELDRIVGEEQRCLARVLEHLAERAKNREVRASVDYDAELIALRDEIASARLEDVPPLLEQMERLQGLAATRREVSEGFVDPSSPYFGHLVLHEGERRREVLIGRSTYLDPGAGIRIVDWRDAPVSRLFYRCEEGEDYDEIFGDREIEGQVLVRRSVTIVDGVLRRIVAPQGTFVQSADGGWRRLGASATRLSGGQGSAVRAEQHRKPGTLGIGETEGREDTHLKEITALIDKRQFELITRPDSGLVVIQGGAGSGKTTIGLHRLAYLAYQDARRFRADRMLVVVFNDALARYISAVLPALGVTGIAIRTYQDWAHKLRAAHVQRLPKRYNEDTPTVVTRLKKHPAMLQAVDRHVETIADRLEAELTAAAGGATEPLRIWKRAVDRALVQRLHALKSWLGGPEARQLATDQRVALEGVVKRGIEQARDVITHFSDLLTDREALGSVFAKHAPGALSAAELDRAHAWCTARIAEILAELEEREDREPERKSGQRAGSGRRDSQHEREHVERERFEHRHGVDGREVDEGATLDREDDTILLRLVQKLRGPLLRPGKPGRQREALVYEHVLVDEAQDLSPVELAVVLGTVSRAQSMTLAGDVSQRLHMDNGFSNWKEVLGELGLDHVQIEPLRISYRSTQEIIDFARDVLGPLANEEEGIATRHGAPVELFGYAHSGDAAGFLAEALRDLMQSEPRASVAVIARYPEQADLYHDALAKGDVPQLRRIAEQDFPFKPGVDVTDVRQVKGLEFDYVVLVEVTAAAYPEDDEARHLLHIGATRAAHQLWVLTTGAASRLLPAALTQRGY